jgi:hypothetical protein
MNTQKAVQKRTGNDPVRPMESRTKYTNDEQLERERCPKQHNKNKTKNHHNKHDENFFV